MSNDMFAVAKRDDLADYQAIDPKDRNTVDYLELRLRDGRLFYVKRSDMSSMAVAPDQTAMTLLFHSASAVVWGVGLAELSRAISAWRIEWVQEYDPARFHKPTDARALFVERIEIYTKSDEDGDARRKPQPAERESKATH